MAKRIAPAARTLWIGLLVLLGTTVQAAQVVYTLRSVADGSLGNHVFSQASVTIQMTADTASVQSTPSLVDPTRPIYTNHAGKATITIDDGGHVIRATFEPGQIYVRYDTGAGVAGFGSAAISPTYPIALDCSNSAYPSDSKYTADCLQGDPWNYNYGDLVYESGILAQLNSPWDPSDGVSALPQSLSASTLLTGEAHTCAGVYTIAPGAWWGGDLWVCGGRAPSGLHTSHGDLFLQDRVGGSNDSSLDRGGWDLANTGFLNVEVEPARADAE
jgi:hypothetical protein